MASLPPALASPRQSEHFMLKEIREQPEVLMRIASYPPALLQQAAALIAQATSAYTTACGTAGHATLAATYFFSYIAKQPAAFITASELDILADFLGPESLIVAASQSGETIETIEAVRAAKRHRSQVLALVNVAGSTLSRLADCSLDLLAGPEQAVPSTKAYTAKLALLLRLAFAVAGKLDEGADLLRRTADAVAELLGQSLDQEIKRLAEKLARQEHLFLLGRDVHYPTALEAALKIKETSYIHAEGLPGGELRHWAIALADTDASWIVFVGNDRSRQAALSDAAELASKGALTIGIGPQRERVFDEFLPVPDVGIASPIINIIPAQLLAYYLARARGLNPDKPRHLTKAVTTR